jgi:D-arabinose 1-dehydrogenase-like Zn-dependent alcohol dehydrogenase
VKIVLMKAARIHEHGGPEVLRYEDAPEPKLRADQVLVRVRACALNHLDLFVRAGIPGMKFAMPHILGSDIAGEVVEVGALCERVKAGWRVLLSPGQSCRQCEQCLSGNDNLCRRYTMFGYAVDGGNCELLAAPGNPGIARLARTVPASLADPESLFALAEHHVEVAERDGVCRRHGRHQRRQQGKCGKLQPFHGRNGSVP